LFVRNQGNAGDNMRLHPANKLVFVSGNRPNLRSQKAIKPREAYCITEMARKGHSLSEQ
jgi:hypothetical protein